MSYINNQNPFINLEEPEVDLKEILSMLMGYKKSIILVIFIITLLATFVAYMKDNVYLANLTLQIESSKDTQKDFIASATGVSGANMGNEVVLLKSRFMAKKVLEKVQLGNRYFVKYSYKKVELYKRSPFQVDVQTIASDLIASYFYIKEVDKLHFLLSLDQAEKNGKRAIVYHKVHTYGTSVKNSFFELTVNKVAPLEAKEYSFTFTPNDSMYPIILSSLAVSPLQDKASVLTLQYKDNIPERAEDILNALAQSYSEQSIKTKSMSAEKTLQFIDNQLAELNIALQISATDLKNYKSEHVMMSVQNKATIASERLNKYEEQMSTLVMQESTLNSLLQYIGNNKDIVGIDLGIIGGASGAIETLINKMQEVDTLRSSLLIDYTPKHPSVLKANEQLVTLKASLIATVEGSLRSIEQRKITLNGMIDKYSQSLASLPEEEKQLAQLNRKLLVKQKIYEFLLQKRSETAIVQSSTASGVRVIDDALSNTRPIQPNRFMIVAMGIIIGLIFGIFQAFTRNIISNTIKTLSDIEAKTTLPVYAILPLFKKKKSLYEDALRMLLTRLEFKEKKPKVITFTSSVQGEGRTTTAVEFAKIIGQSSKKVIVLDLDMRSSRVKDKLKISNESGVSTYLNGNDTLHNVTQALNEYVDVIVAGPVPTNPYELIVSEQFKALLEELKLTYDYVLLESPPVGLVADALVLMGMSDLNLIVFKANYSKKDFLKNINRFVYEHKLDNVGIILNALELKKIRTWIKK